MFGHAHKNVGITAICFGHAHSTVGITAMFGHAHSTVGITAMFRHAQPSVLCEGFLKLKANLILVTAVILIHNCTLQYLSNKHSLNTKSKCFFAY